MSKKDLLLPLTTLGSAAFMSGLLIAGFLILQTGASLPNAQAIKDVELKIPLRVFSSEGLMISEFGNERRKPVAIADVPPMLIEAILASEDDGFYSHRGIDFSGLVRAAITNLKSGQTQQGASTITMQVAQNFFLTREKTYSRKLRQVLLAIKLEQILSKREILSLYINKIFLGYRSYGFGAAADTYYAKELNELTLAEMAMLAGLPKAPSANNPLRNPVRATNRRNYVLGRLRTLDKINEAQYVEAVAAPVTAERHARTNYLDAPHIAEMVRAKLIDEYGEGVYWQGLNVHTTIQARAQQAATLALRKGLRSYDQRHGYRGPIARIDLNELTVNDADAPSPYHNVLSGYPSSGGQIPALVLEVDDTAAVAQTKEHGEITLSLDGARWAKRLLTADQVGDAPQQLGEVLAVGDIVYVKAAEDSEPEPDAATDEPVRPDWQLSQIPDVSGALISMEPATGRILSLVGGYDFFLNKYNRAVQSVRQPGSNIKPFIYSAALERGFTPATLISGGPIVITDQTHGIVWRPENYSGEFFGPTRMREALGKSLNLVSIRLLRSIGVPYARAYAARFGIDMSRFSPTLTMALGSGGITPMEMLTAYGSLANGGYKIEPYFIDHISDRAGNIIYRAQQAEFCDECYRQYIEPLEADDPALVNTEISAEEVVEAAQSPSEEVMEDLVDVVPETYQAPRIMSRANNFLTVSMLKDVVRRGTARKAMSLERSDLAGKTGTTNDYVDAWFTGFNSKIATTVWLGFDDPTTMGRGEAGSKAALPIWIDYMRVALDGIAEDSEQIPEYIEQGLVNRSTGERTTDEDPAAVTEYFVLDHLLPEWERPMGTASDPMLSEEQTMPEEPGPEEEITPAPEVEAQERIIETSEDTEGLF